MNRLSVGFFALAATMMLSGCGVTGNSGVTTLSVNMKAQGSDTEVSRVLGCPAGEDPTGSFAEQWPDDAVKACKQLATVDLSVFNPHVTAEMCTDLYGGPFEANVRGTIKGKEVDGDFGLYNGCEISRWDAIRELLDPISQDSAFEGIWPEMQPPVEAP